MSERYEVGMADCDLAIITPGVAPGEHALDVGSDNYALVIGDPWAAAFAVVGSPQELRGFARRVSKLVSGLPDDNARDEGDCRQT